MPEFEELPIDLKFRNVRGPIVAQPFAGDRDLLVTSLAVPSADSVWYRLDFYGVAAMHVCGHSVCPPSHEILNAGMAPTARLRARLASELIDSTMLSVDWEHWGDADKRRPVHYSVEFIGRLDLNIIAKTCIVGLANGPELTDAPAPLPPAGEEIHVFDLRVEP